MNNKFCTSRLPICYLDLNGPAQFGKQELEKSFAMQGVKLQNVNHWTKDEIGDSPLLMIGTTSNRRIQILLENAKVSYNSEPEGVIYHWCRVMTGKVLVIAGTDSVGLMYALLEMADRVEYNGIEAFNSTENLVESPENVVRCVDRYIVGHLDDEWFKSEKFWRYYLKRLAKSRFNRFCLIVGFDTAYMAPPYPFFVNVKGYEHIVVSGLDERMRDENLHALRRLGQLCHEHGLLFEFATWQQRPWTSAQKQLVQGLADDEEALGEYCYHGLKALIHAVPEIDIVQFRVNHESGVGTQTSAEDFWNRCVDAVAEVAKEDNRPLIMDLRAKGLTDSMIDHAFSTGLHVEVPTKYWCEHAALPYHLSVMRTEELAQLDNFNHSRRYSYADLLKKPRYYDVIYRLWNYGSTNLFIWGDVDYARRFSKSCSLSGSAGLEINSPLSLKYGHELIHKEHWYTFADPSLRSGEWEDERFWLWYIAFGRLGYSTNTTSEVWMRVFRRHFGVKSASLIEHTLRTASKIVPLVTAIHMPVHPSLRYWTEMSTGWALFSENNLDERKDYDFYDEITYGSTEPSDKGLFYGIDEYASDLFRNELKGKYSPLQTSQWLETLAEDILRCVEKIDTIGENGDNAEYRAMRTDMLLLCDFARYHAKKIHSAFALACFRLYNEKTYLADSALLLKQAKEYWVSLSELGLKAYHHDLEFSTAGSKTRHGTWMDLLCEIEADEKTLTKMLVENNIVVSDDTFHSYLPIVLPVERYTLSSNLPGRHKAGTPLTIEVNVGELLDYKDEPFVLHYRHTNQMEGLFNTVRMTRTDTGWIGTIPGEYIVADWDLMVYVTMQGRDGSCLMLPGVYHPVFPFPYHVVTIEE